MVRTKGASLHHPIHDAAMKHIHEASQGRPGQVRSVLSGSTLRLAPQRQRREQDWPPHPRTMDQQMKKRLPTGKSAFNAVCLAAGYKPGFPNVKMVGVLSPTRKRSKLVAYIAKQPGFGGDEGKAAATLSYTIRNFNAWSGRAYAPEGSKAPLPGRSPGKTKAKPKGKSTIDKYL